MQVRHRAHGALTAGAMLATLLAACAAGGETGAGEDLTLTVTAPDDGAEVSVPFEVELESSVELGPPESADHHAHLYFDADTSSEDFDMVYGTTAEVTRDLPAGEHTIIASLRNANHSDAGPSQEFTVTVADEGGGDDDPASAPPATDEGGIDDY